MDFVSDALFNGKRFRALTVVDAFTRECLGIFADQGIKGEQLVDVMVMDRLFFERGKPPAKIRVDNGPEFIYRALDHWAYINRVTLDFSRPGKPSDNAFVVSFNGRFAITQIFAQLRWDALEPEQKPRIGFPILRHLVLSNPER